MTRTLAAAGWSVGRSAMENAAQTPRGPGWLRMAVTATQAMVKFLGSGLKTVSRPQLERRLQTCLACPHSTGLRCRLCGCFANAKARLPQEACPLGHW